ncbi:MAG: hypothetical protein D6704_10060 [Nitrospirae bacterium]|nr:MAG: hypothetical protein D6704_10060 [Nitrospirota bacterium]
MNNVRLLRGLLLVAMVVTGGEAVPQVLAQGPEVQQPTKTIVGDLLMIDRDLYIVRGERGEIQIQATSKTEVTEEFGFGDRIKALVLMNGQALRIERAAPTDVPGVTINKPVETPPAMARGQKPPESQQPRQMVPQRPTTKTVIGDLLMIDGDFYVVRGERGEIRLEATPDTKIAEEFHFGDRIKATALMNDKALTIERAGPNELPGVIIHEAPAAPAMAKEAAPAPKTSGKPSALSPMPEQAAGSAEPETRVVEGEVLMVDGDFYVLRGERGEIRVERTEKTKMTEEFKFGDRIRAILLPNDKALVIERAK